MGGLMSWRTLYVAMRILHLLSIRRAKSQKYPTTKVRSRYTSKVMEQLSDSGLWEPISVSLVLGKCSIPLSSSESIEVVHCVLGCKGLPFNSCPNVEWGLIRLCRSLYVSPRIIMDYGVSHRN